MSTDFYGDRVNTWLMFCDFWILTLSRFQTLELFNTLLQQTTNPFYHVIDEHKESELCLISPYHSFIDHYIKQMLYL